MKTQGLWFKCVVLAGGVVLLGSAGSAWMVSSRYAQISNDSSLREVTRQVQEIRKETEDDIRHIISDLIYLQKKNQNHSSQSSNFTVYGVLQKDNKEILSIYPGFYKQQFQNLSHIPYQYLKHFPIAFHSVQMNSHRKQVLFLVDVDQIQKSFLPENLSKGKILFGIPSVSRLSKISQSLAGGGFTEAFILDGARNWQVVHSYGDYSGHFLPPQSVFVQLARKNQTSWSRAAPSERVLTAGVKMKIMNAYLVVNKKAVHWTEFYLSFFNEIFLVLFCLGLLLFLFIFVLISPLLQAYEYLTCVFKHYAVSNKFPIPGIKQKNSYILAVMPWLKKIYWTLRDKQLTQAVQHLDASREFSNMLKQLVSEFEEKYPNIRFQLKTYADIQLPAQENWLKQAVLEVLKNAVECMNFKGKIDICTSKEDQLFYCTIRDYGSGMSDSVMSQACEAYYSSKAGASGLGLTLACSALSRVGAQIQFSNPDDDKPGLKVCISMPFHVVKKTRPEGLHL